MSMALVLPTSLTTASGRGDRVGAAHVVDTTRRTGVQTKTRSAAAAASSRLSAASVMAPRSSAAAIVSGLRL